jgi:hypothetical protein
MTVAALQLTSKVGCPDENHRHAAPFIEDAANRGAQLETRVPSVLLSRHSSRSSHLAHPASIFARALAGPLRLPGEIGISLELDPPEQNHSHMKNVSLHLITVAAAAFLSSCAPSPRVSAPTGLVLRAAPASTGTALATNSISNRAESSRNRQREGEDRGDRSSLAEGHLRRQRGLGFLRVPNNGRGGA